MEELEALRTQINSVDQQLMKLFIEREQICIGIGRVKKAAGKEILDTGREEVKMQANRQCALGIMEEQGISKEQQEVILPLVDNLTQTLMAAGREIQSKID